MTSLLSPPIPVQAQERLDGLFDSWHLVEAADGVVVVRQDAALRAEPVLAGEAGARARAGELARVSAASRT